MACACLLYTSYNIVDVEAAAERKIPVCNVPSYGTDAVAQFAIGLLLEICHHIGHHSRMVHQGKWGTCSDWCFWDYPLIELAGKTFGIAGFGHVGQKTGRIAASMGMNAVSYTHLDVYKRQIYEIYYRNQREITIIGLEPHPEDKKNGAYDRIKPVSYTHLDVYKRQPN